ncbi:MAG: metal ABC transporter ATP-binding protein [Pigmentiphaga sp.]|nr:metal ABC transporter ATP-binding protein [Pigmentiphaga sp.]
MVSPAATPKATAPLSVTGLTVSYNRKMALFSLDFTVPPQAMGVIVGPNGAGKSTLLKSVLDIVPRVSGEVRVFGSSFAANRHRVAYVPQRASVDWEFPATVFDVAAMGLYRELSPLRLLGRAHRERVMACLAQVGMSDLARRQIGQLSGGQQQRVFFARALVQGADLYLLDEPFAGVDAATERTLIQVLHGLNALGKTVLCVHHDLSTVPEYFDHVLLLNVRHVASGPVASTFTAATLQETYGDRLAEGHLQRLAAMLAPSPASVAVAAGALGAAAPQSSLLPERGARPASRRP